MGTQDVRAGLDGPEMRAFMQHLLADFRALETMIAEGQLENVNYRVTDRDPEAGTCMVHPSTSLLITREQPMTVDDDEPVHQVTNCPACDQRALSVHIYSKPFDICEIYSKRDDGRWSYGDVNLSYWSEYGKRTP